MVFCTLKDFLVGHHIGSRKNWTIFRLKLLKSILTKTNIFWFQHYMVSKNKIFPDLSINALVASYLQNFIVWQRKVSQRGLKKEPDLEYSCPICLLIKATQITIGITIYVSKFALRFMLKMCFYFFNVESICFFSSNVWIYVLLHNIHLVFHTE